MRHILLLPVLILATNFAVAQSTTKFNLDDLKWKHRVLVVIASDSTEKSTAPLLNQVERYQADFLDRNMVLIALLEQNISHIDGVPLDQPSGLDLRDKLSIENFDFRIVLIGKDGGIKLDRNVSTDLNDIFAHIDTMPMRRSEMRRKQGGY